MKEHRQALIDLLDEMLAYLQEAEPDFYPNPENFLEAIRMHNHELFEAAEDVQIACEMLINLQNDQQLKGQARGLWSEQFKLLQAKADRAMEDLNRLCSQHKIAIDSQVKNLKETCI
jgi:hypothetical protein